jgi:hypothetical protein
VKEGIEFLNIKKKKKIFGKKVDGLIDLNVETGFELNVR